MTKRILSLLAYPGDTFGTGGTIARCARAGEKGAATAAPFVFAGGNHSVYPEAHFPFGEQYR